MRDRFEAGLWASHGSHFSRDLDTAFRRFARGFAMLNALQWSAPWRRTAGRDRPGLA